MRWRVAILILILISLGLPLLRRWQLERDPMVKKIAKTMDKCPVWLAINKDDIETRKRVVKAMLELSRYDLDILRQGMIGYIKAKSPNHTRLEVIGQFYILNRLLFNVPEKAPLTSPCFGGWAGVPQDGETINQLWPLSFDKKSKIVLTGTFHGYYGPPYRPLDEFDYFREKYGVRKR